MSDYGGRLIRDTEPTVTSTTASGIWTIEEALKYKKAGTWPTFTTDPNFKQTVLLLYGDGTNGAQNNTFLDSSTNNFTITRNGNTTQGTFSPFSLAAGEWSNYFDGTGDYLTTPDNAAFDLGTSNFTIEGWVYIAATSGSQQSLCAKGTGADNQASYHIALDGSTWKYYLSGNGSTWSIASGVSMGASAGLNVWQHIALVRNGSTFTPYINGVAGTTTTSATALFDSNKVLSIGSDDTGGQRLTGYISNFRIVKGTAVYTAAFTPPTTPLTAITNTSLLTCQSNRFVDNSTNAFAITRNGDVRVTPFSPFAPTAAYSAGTNGGSGYFDGTGDRLTAPANAAFQPGTGDFSLEAFFYSQTTAVAGLCGTNYTGASPNTYIIITLNRDSNTNNTAGAISAFLSDAAGNAITTSSAVFSNNTWNHVVFCRTGSTLSLFLNGSRVGSITNTTNITPNIQFEVGDTSALTRPFAGSISNVRFIKGSHPYDATQTTYIVPTAPLTAITNTSLLLNFTNAGIIDNTGKNVLETVGNAQIDTTTKKFGTGSLEFDGTGDFLSFPQSEELSMGSGSFTYELWINPTDNTAVCIFDTRTANNNTTGFTLLLNGSSNLAIYTNTTVLTCSGTVSTGVWTHIAVVRNGTTLTVYANGSSVGTLTFSNNLTDKSFRVGEYVDGTGDFTGFIDDLRITKGVARYTANFTAPTAPFLDQ